KKSEATREADPARPHRYRPVPDYEPLPTKDGGTLRTIGEACDYMTSIGKKRELRQHWQWVCKMILAKEDVLTVSRALELALFYDARWEVYTPSRRSPLESGVLYGTNLEAKLAVERAIFRLKQRQNRA